MKVLIVESGAEIAEVWRRHLSRAGHDVRVAHSADAGVARLTAEPFGIVILNVLVDGESALSIADYARFRNPDSRVIFVSESSFFSDGSIFGLVPNARAMVPAHTPPEDLTALVEHYGQAS